ncbi:MAG: S8 family serine peptidase [Cyclobacteriaceae bacterium]
MQKILNIIILIFLLIQLASCEEEPVTVNEIKTVSSSNGQGQNSNQGGSNSNISWPEYSSNQLIIRYHPAVTQSGKAQLRNAYGVIAYEPCQVCFDGDIERWTFQRNIDIEPRKKAIENNQNDPGGLGMPTPILDVNPEKSFDVASLKKSTMIAPGSGDLAAHLSTSDTGTTVAILDTGIDTNYTLFNDLSGSPSGFLYNPSPEEAVAGEVSGWDFVNEDNDPFDDELSKHGTAVSYILFKTARQFDIPIRILPVKIADKYGKISYFHLLCAIKFAATRADIINISAGWYDDNSHDNSIMAHLLAENPETLVVTSAGNLTFNNDRDDVLHLPSSFLHPNIVAVAAAKRNNSGVWRAASSFSNYGLTNVDFFAPGKKIPFYNPDGTIADSISGTSFAAPYVTAKAAEIIAIHDYPLTPEVVISKMNETGIPVTFDIPTKYNKLILPPTFD